MWLLILGLGLFLSLVVLHELGHFIVARRGGVEVEEFGLGFPPTLWSRRVKSGFLFTINLLPLGGFVRLKGEHDRDSGKGSFGAAPLRTKVKIMLAGIGMNLAIAWVLLTILAWIGMPQAVPNQFKINSDSRVIREVKDQDHVLVDGIIAGSAASKTALKVNDWVKSFDGQPVTSPDQLVGLTHTNAGKLVDIGVQHSNGQAETISVRLGNNHDGKGYLGVSPRSGQSGIRLERSTWSAPIVSSGLIVQFTTLTFKGIGSALTDLFHGHAAQASEQVSGPVGIFVILRDGAALGFQFILFIIALLSLTLALMNVLPIPALDGGRLFVTVLFRSIKRPLTPKLEERIHGTGFVLLLGLITLLTVVDVRRFF